MVDAVGGSFAFSSASADCVNGNVEGAADGAKIPELEDEIEVWGVKEAKGLFNTVDDCSDALPVAKIEDGAGVDVAEGASAC
jgi:hypothetical protein